MIRAALKAALYFMTTLALAWLVFFVPLGERTLFEHLWRIAGTEEARDLGREALEAGQRAEDAVRDRVQRQE
jgi:hypothetical protein